MSTISATPTSGRSPGSRAQRQQRTVELYARLRQDDSRDEVLAEVVTAHLDLADRIARRFRGRGVEEEDLRQVACLALFRAAAKFDPDAGSDFLSYAVPTMTGEIRKHFRDHGWMVRPPRRIQDLQSRVNGALTDLAHELGRTARPSELAERLDVPLDEVIEALSCDGCFTPTSLDRPVGEHDSGTLGDLLSAEDTDQPDPSGYAAAEARMMLAPVVRALPERDRLVLELRYFRSWTQRQIGVELGISQMQVSRILSRILRTMRTNMTAPSDVPETPRPALAPAV